MNRNNIEVHYQDGRIRKGFTLDFFPTKPTFHLTPAEAPQAVEAVEVGVPQLKAIFFLRGRAGPLEPDACPPASPPKPPPLGRKIRVRFKDGELLVGTTQGYDASRPGFFVVPGQCEAHIDRIFVVRGATEHVSFL